MGDDLREIKEYRKRLNWEAFIVARDVFEKEPAVEISKEHNTILLLTHNQTGRQYYFVSKTNKWRSAGKSVWYRSRGARDFLDRFVL